MFERNNFSFDELVFDMVDNIDEKYFISSTTIFLDPAMAGGQFVVEIEERLREYGHSDENIKGRVFGYHHNIIELNCAINDNGLVGTYEVKDFINDEITMRPDAIVSNPPFQSTNNTDKKQPESHNLWSKFALKANEILADDGYIAFITPDSWGSPNSKVLKMFKENSLLNINTNISQYFNGIGSSFTAWTYQKNHNTKTVDIDGTKVDLDALHYLPRDPARTFSIHNKVINTDYDRLNVACDTKAAHSDWKKKAISKEQDAEYKYPTHHTNAQRVFAKKKSNDFDSYKVVWTTSGYFKPFLDDGNIGTTETSLYIVVADETEGNNLMSYFNSKVYQFIIATGKWSGFINARVCTLLPKLENKFYTDEELYNLFNLTAEEISIIEATV